MIKSIWPAKFETLEKITCLFMKFAQTFSTALYINDIVDRTK